MFNRIRLILLALLLGLAGSALAQDTKPMKPGHEMLTFTSTWDGSEQPYRLYVPENLKPGAAPLLVVLHGRGVDENAWFDYTPVASAADKHGYIVASPLGRGSWWYRGAAEQDVLDIVEHVKNSRAVDATRVYLIGHSMGGWGTSWISMRNPGVFAACAPMSGWAPEELLINARHCPPFFLHDDTDPIVTVVNSRAAAAGLAEAGISFRYREEHGYGHSSKLIGENFDRIFPWLSEHRLDTAPARVSFATRTPRKGDAFWVRILDTAEFPRTGRVIAESNEKGLVITTARVRRFAVDLATMPGNGDEIAVQVDGETSQTLQRSGWLVFQRRSDQWRIRRMDSAPEPGASPMVKLPFAARLQESTPQEFTAMFAELVREEAGADLALFRYDMFRNQGRPMDLDRLVETYVYPVEYLARVGLNGSQVRAELEKDEDLVLAGDDPSVLSDDQIYSVIAPMDYARKFAPSFELLPRTVPEYLVAALAAKRER